MKRKKRDSSSDVTNVELSEALSRLSKTRPTDLDETLANAVLEREARIRERIRSTREEIEDGGRPRKGRFRL